VLAQRKRFELRITDEDRQRLRTLAEQQATTESGVFRALLRQAEIVTTEDSAGEKGERIAA
jgi:predicted DNA-binding protein